MRHRDPLEVAVFPDPVCDTSEPCCLSLLSWERDLGVPALSRVLRLSFQDLEELGWSWRCGWEALLKLSFSQTSKDGFLIHLFLYFPNPLQ